MRQALAGLLWTKQYYELRRRPLAARARRQPAGTRTRRTCATSPGSTCHRRHHLDARQVGVPVVRGLGPGLPLRAAVAGRRRLRQGAARAAAAHALPAPERPDPGLRVELLRRQPAGARPGRRCWSTSARRRSAARATASSWRASSRAADELHLVGQPQGPRRPQPLPGRLPRPRQHRRLRPLGAAAGRRDAASRPTARRGWRSIASTCCRSRSSSAASDPSYDDIALKFVEHFVWIAVALNRPAPTRRCGTRRTASSTTCCGCPTGRRSRCACARWSGCCRCARRRSSSPRSLDGQPGLVERALEFAEHFGDSVPALAHLPGPNPDGRRLLALVNEEQLRPHPRRHARRGRVPRPARHPLALALPPRRTRTSSTGTASTTRSATCRPSPTAACSAATRTGAGRSGSR